MSAWHRQEVTDLVSAQQDIAKSMQQLVELQKTMVESLFHKKEEQVNQILTPVQTFVKRQLTKQFDGFINEVIGLCSTMDDVDAAEVIETISAAIEEVIRNQLRQ